ncbi:MAG: hypothetical protein WCX12_01630 [Candidatus Paceibacterota bacterium]|jgi:hypothetical protein
MPDNNLDPTNVQDGLKSLGPIENVNASTWTLIKNKYRSKSIAVLIIAVFVAIFLNPFFVIVIGFIYYIYIRNKVQAEFMRQFATAQKFEYAENMPLDAVKGRLFKLGHSQTIENVVSGNYQNRPLKIFNYQYTVGGGKNQTTHQFTVLEISFSETIFPHILLQSETMMRFDATSWGEKNQDTEINLEEQFRKNYHLFATDGYEIEVLQIFTGEMLEFLGQKGSNFSIEFAENRMYIYDDLFISKITELRGIFGLAEKILDLSGPLLDRLHDDFAALDPYYKK